MRRPGVWLVLVLAACRAESTPAPIADASTKTDVAALAAQIAPAVVTIHVGDREGEQRATGAGFIVGADGLIATCHHVIGEGRPIEVELADGRRFDVTMVQAFDRAQDVALLRIEADGLPTLEIGDPTTLHQGDPLLAMGNPLGFEKTITTGVVSALREIDGRTLIQLAMPIEPGNSGGPVVDRSGRVHGIVTMKSIVTNNLAFAVPVTVLRAIHERPNPVPMSRWLTIGALDETKWSTLFGARWRQRAGRIVVDRPGRGMAGRALCLSTQSPPKRPYVMSADVKLDDADGAAGIAFASDGGNIHYAFYPTRHRLRLTRFEGPDVFSWRILFDRPSAHYRPGAWNRLEVRHEKKKIACYVNGHLVAEVDEQTLPAGRFGFVKFRNTQAEMKRLELHGADEARIASAADRLLSKAQELEWEAAGLRQRALALHKKEVADEIVAALEGSPPDLLRATLLIAKLDNADVDVDAYVAEVDRMARELALRFPPTATPYGKLVALGQYLFEENGFHGSRDDYHHRANSYLNEVMDDREGLPITLSILYLELGHRIGVPIAGVALPGHFVVRFRDTLIDPFDGGREMSAADASALIHRHTGRAFQRTDLAPAPPRAIAVRVLRNLLKTARRENDAVGQLTYLDTILRIDPTAAQDRLRRAHVRVRSGLAKEAVADFERLLSDEAAGIDLDEVQRFRDLLIEQER